ncbi:MAG: carboxypeptidase-like regulatory domain-containing protein [Verrucomicrobia bacterium]|nr:carboxypeptidase-like regulatory domain-containing protein [Verrucomicrobiota bacterium]
MNQRRFSLIVIILVLLAGVFWLWSLKKVPPAPPPPVVAEAQTPPLAPVTPTTSKVVPPPRTTDKEELNQWWVKMNKLDKNFEWKMPIEFYGKVVDDKDQPIEKTTIRFQWTDLSREGTSEYNTISDSQGLFRLDGVTGKNLGVQVRKEGYKHYFIGTQFSFEYAAYFEDSFHVPDRNNPVIFRLRKNREAEALIFRNNQEAEIAVGQKRSFSIGSSGAAVVIERLPDIPDYGRRGWAARVSVPGGGLVLSTEEFPFEAPENGYAPFIEVTDKTPKPLVWQSDNGAAFFVKTPQGYGRITVRNTQGAAWVYVTSYLNPNPNSRNLEFDPAKVIKPAP